MSDKANDELEAAAKRVLVARMNKVYAGAVEKPMQRVVVVEHKTVRKERQSYQSKDESTYYVFGNDVGPVSACHWQAEKYHGGMEFGWHENTPYLELESLWWSETHKELERRGYYLQIELIDEFTNPPAPPAGEEPCKNSSEPTEL